MARHLAENEPSAAVGARAQSFDSSPRQAAQRKQIQALFGAASPPLVPTRLAQRDAPPGTVAQRAHVDAVVTKATGAAIHKSNVKKVDSGEADKLTVRSGGMFGTGIKRRVPVGETLTVDVDRSTDDGTYVWASYTSADGDTYEGFVARRNVRLPTDAPSALDGSDSSGEMEPEDLREGSSMEEGRSRVEASSSDPVSPVAQDIALARRLLDPYLATHTIGQHMDPRVVRNHAALTQSAGAKASDAEAWTLRTQGVADRIGRQANESVRGAEDAVRDQEEELKTMSVDQLIDRIVELSPDTEVREQYEGAQKWDLIKQLSRQRARQPVRREARLNPQAEVWQLPAFWKNKGDALRENPMSPIVTSAGQGKVPLWCDQSVAIIIATLQDRDDFHSSLTVIKQGDPKQHGHWYVLANHRRDRQPTFGEALQPGEFIIDIWGSLRLNEIDGQVDTTVHETGARALLNTAVVSEDREKAKFDEQNRMQVLAHIDEK